MDQPLVLIVILNWNDFEETVSAVESVFQMDYPNFRVMIVDNASSDGSVERLRELRSDRVELVELSANGGYTGGCNLGMERALNMGVKYVWLLNNDTTTDAHTLSSLVALAESDDHVGLVSPLIASHGPGREIVFAGGWWDKNSGAYVDTHNIELAKKWMEEHPNAGVVFGTALLVPTRLIRAIGMLDDKFFAYYEDFDYSIRSLEAGFRNLVDWSSTVYHLNKSMARRPEEIRPHYWYYVARNERRLWRKHLGWFGSLRISWWSTNKFIQHYNRCKGNPVSRQAILAGIWHGWLGRTGPYSPTLSAPGAVGLCAELYSKRPALQVDQEEKS